MNLVLSLAFLATAFLLAAVATRSLMVRRSATVERRLREIAPGADGEGGRRSGSPPGP